MTQQQWRILTLSHSEQGHYEGSKFALYFSNCLRQLHSDSVISFVFSLPIKREELAWLIAHRTNAGLHNKLAAFAATFRNSSAEHQSQQGLFCKRKMRHVCNSLKNALSTGRFLKIKYQQLNLSDKFSKWFCHKWMGTLNWWWQNIPITTAVQVFLSDYLGLKK